MSLINCPECASVVSKQAISCPKCGFPMNISQYQPKSPGEAYDVGKAIKKEKTKESLGVYMVIGLVIISIIIGVNFSALPAIIVLLAGMVAIWKFYWK